MKISTKQSLKILVSTKYTKYSGMIYDFPNIVEHNFKTEQNMESEMFQRKNICIINHI